MLQQNLNAVFSSSSESSSFFAFRPSHFLSPPPIPLSLRFFSMAADDDHHIRRKLQLCHSSSTSSFKLLNPVLACRASPDSHETTSSLRNDNGSPVHGLSEMIVGVLGGGQLGRMLCQAASKMAIKVMVLDPSENCPASALAYDHMVGSFDDSATVQEFAKRCGVLTVEIEHVDVATLERLEQQGVDCEPRASTIRIIQDKFLQKVHFSQHAIPLPEFMEIDDLEGAKRSGDLFGYPLMIKSKRLAYDGRGNAVAKSEEELPSAISGKGVGIKKDIIIAF
ncbi:phosphoribosylaminoimidazole carboxylase, chloroplastic [Herrania umbratica]|uniref:Phosphoribosylaminoimidazole carboxylase, chloroplastic n=1 Tax=Herrania umbratica TaxID=108875 RepID=A0A6J1A7Q1_9ROSI|nr:phosphoribosylaminoimidazole carboxylase, chloroplastic [Herrania umbratica]